MNAVGKAWTVAASIGVVEAMKDQVGFCRWNYPLSLLHQHAKNNARTLYQTKNLISPSPSTSPSSSASLSSMRGDRMNRSEERMRKVMDLNCWGPTTVRF